MENKIEIYGSLIARHVEREKVGFEEFAEIMDALSSLVLIMDVHKEHIHEVTGYIGSDEWYRRTSLIDSLKIKLITNLANL
jgi:hypothetical protein